MSVRFESCSQAIQIMHNIKFKYAHCSEMSRHPMKMLILFTLYVALLLVIYVRLHHHFVSDIVLYQLQPTEHMQTFQK